jgi:hypothetical protein
MAYNQLANLDYFEIKSALRDYLRANSDFSDYDFEGSTLGMLLDVLAYNTYYTAFNANMIANEAFLDSATLRDNVVSIAKQLGYTPRSAVSSSAAVTTSFNVTSSTSLPDTIIFRKGNAFVTTINDTLYQYVLLEDVQSTVSPTGQVTFENLKIQEGILITNRYTVTDISKPFIIKLLNEKIDTKTISVNVYENQNSSNFVKFVQSDNISTIGPNSNSYFIDEIEDENYKLTFGDNIFARKLELNNVVEVSYVITNGSDTNGAGNFTFSGILTDRNGVSNFQISNINTTVLAKSFGGSDIESIDSIRLNAPAIYGAQNRAVTSTDYAAIIRRIYPSASDIIAYGGEEASPPEYGKIKISIKPKNLSYLSNYAKKLILDELKKFSVASIVPDLVDASIIFIEANSRIFYDQSITNSTPNDIKQKIISNISNYIDNSNTEKFGGKFRYSKFVAVIDASDRAIRSNLTDVIMRKDFYPSLNNKTYYELCFNNAFDDDIDVQTLTSTGFVVQEYPNYTVFLEDRDDKIVLYRLDSQSGEKIILNSNQGTIDYVKGEVKLFDLTIIQGSFPDNKIEVRLKPKYNDIIAKREIFLDFDIDKSSLTLIQE